MGHYTHCRPSVDTRSARVASMLTGAPRPHRGFRLGMAYLNNSCAEVVLTLSHRRISGVVVPGTALAVYYAT